MTADGASKSTPIHAVVRGSGPPVYLLHSGGMSSRQWRLLGALLEQKHTVVAPDFIGSGENPPFLDDAAFDFHKDVDAVADLIERRHVAPIDLVGHSYGGLVALTLAKSLGDRVRKIVVYDPVAFGVLRAAHDPEGLADLERAEESPVFGSDAVGGSAEWFEVFVDYWNGPGSFAALPEPAKQGFLRVGRKVYREVRSLMSDRTPAAAYAGMSASALLLGGERTPLAARRALALLAAALPNASVQTILGAGHMGPITHAAEVNRLVAAYLD